jgi:hypothetical protein
MEAKRMTSKDQGQEPHASTTGNGPGQSQEQQAALYGPAGRADYKPGDTIEFSSRDTGGKVLSGEILFVRAPAPAIVGGRIHPTSYIVAVEGESFIRVVYPGDVIERHQKS